jgi:NTE family protein
VIHQASRFVSHSLLGLGAQVPVALLNSSPLRRLLNDRLQMDGIAEAIAQKQLHAVAVTAFGYESGQAVTFYQGAAPSTLAAPSADRRAHAIVG